MSAIVQTDFPSFMWKQKKARKAVWANVGGMAFVKFIDFRARFAVNVLQQQLSWQYFSKINPPIKGYDSILLLVSLLCMCSWKLLLRSRLNTLFISHVRILSNASRLLLFVISLKIAWSIRSS